MKIIKEIVKIILLFIMLTGFMIYGLLQEPLSANARYEISLQGGK